MQEIERPADPILLPYYIHSESIVLTNEWSSMRVVRGVSPKQLNSGVCCFRVPPAFGKDTPNGTLVLHRRLKGEWRHSLGRSPPAYYTKRRGRYLTVVGEVVSKRNQTDSCSSSSAVKAIISCFRFVLNLVPFYRDAHAAGIWG